MSGRVALDTNIVIRHIRGDEAVVHQTQKIVQVIPVPVLAELRYAAHNSSRRTENERIIEDLLESTEVLSLTATTTRWYAEVRWKLKQVGKPIPENDLWIAASCLEHHLPLATGDAHFQVVSGLKVYDW